MWGNVRNGLERFLEWVVTALLVAMVVIVVLGVLYRKFGDSLVWYDEVASIVLAWLTYYGSALAALKRAHIGFSGLVDAAPGPWRLVLVVVAELIVLGFFVLLAWVGYEVLLVLEGDTLISLPQVSVQITQSVIPIGAALFVLAQLVSLPDVIERARSGRRLHTEEFEP
ncbi:MAG: TRAP transporter small permease [Gammaproteobacteria bacterium]|nr:TRAP transporter small permease [Gammaproteobacteria bacterium]